MEILIDFTALILLYIFKFFKKWKSQGKDKLIVNTLIYIYISFVLFFTIMPIITSLPRIFDHPYVPMNFNAFDDVFNSRGDFIRQVVLNVIMMIPFGFLLPITNKKINFKKIILYTFLFSLCIELLQPLINGVRSADVTDLITNTLGGIIGYIFYIIFKPVITKVFKELK